MNKKELSLVVVIFLLSLTFINWLFCYGIHDFINFMVNYTGW